VSLSNDVPRFQQHCYQYCVVVASANVIEYILVPLASNIIHIYSFLNAGMPNMYHKISKMQRSPRFIRTKVIVGTVTR